MLDNDESIICSRTPLERGADVLPQFLEEALERVEYLRTTANEAMIKVVDSQEFSHHP